MSPRRKPRFGQAFVIGTVVAVALLGGVIFAGVHFYREAFPNVAILRSQFPRVIPQKAGEPPLVRLEKSRPPGWTPLSSVSRAAVGAVIVSEDWAFYQHKGYDANQIREAIEQSLEEGHFVRGASTITQQVAKNVFLSRDKTLWRKFRELVLALRLEKELGKKKILETYLNVAEWGPGVYGIGQAARYYFQKSPSELTAKEGAFLAILLPSPIRYGQSFRKKQLTPFVVSSIRNVLGKMVRAGFLSDEERQLALVTPLSFEEGAAPVVQEEVTEEAEEPTSSSAPSDEPPLPEELFDGASDSGT